MRIGFFTDYYLPVKTGVSTSIASFRDELEKLGHEVFIFAPSDSMLVREEDDHIIRFPAIKGLFVENYMTSVFFPPQQIRKIEKLNLDIIHFHTPSQIGLLGVHVALKNDIRLVGTYHTDLHQYAKTYQSIGVWSAILGLLAPIVTGGGFKDVKLTRPNRSLTAMNEQAVERSMTMIHNYCDLVIAPSKKMELQLKRWKTTAPIEILPTGVDKITTNKAEIDDRKQQYSINDNDLVVMYAGRLGKEKNLELLIKAAAQARKKLPTIKVLLAGDFKHGDDLLELAAAHDMADAIIKTGYIENDQLGSVFGCANLFVLPSLSDTQCLVLNEAAHAGLPLIAVDPLINEVVQDSVNGLLTKPTITALSAGIVTILSDAKLAEQMGKASVVQARKFSEAAQATKLANTYQSILDSHQI